MTDTPTEREAESTWTEAAPPQGGAVGTGVCGRNSTIPAASEMIRPQGDKQ